MKAYNLADKKEYYAQPADEYTKMIMDCAEYYIDHGSHILLLILDKKVDKLIAGETEGYATYPQFMKSDSEFYATYRELTSSNGRWKVYKYNHESKTFAATTSEYIADGSVTYPTSCPYFQRWEYDKKSGYFYNAWCWRSTGDVINNYDLMFIKTKNFEEFYTWTNETITLPITLENYKNCRLLEIPKGSGLINQHYIKAFPLNGNPFIWFMKYDERGYANIFLIYDETGNIVVKQITNFDYLWAIEGNLQSRVIDTDLMKINDTTVALNIFHRFCGNQTILIHSDGYIENKKCIVDGAKTGKIIKYIRNYGVRLLTEFENPATTRDTSFGIFLID